MAKKKPSKRPYWYYAILSFLVVFVSQPIASKFAGSIFAESLLSTWPWIITSFIAIYIADAVMKSVMPTTSDKSGKARILETLLLSVTSVLFTPVILYVFVALQVPSGIVLGTVGAVTLSAVLFAYDRVFGLLL